VVEGEQAGEQDGFGCRIAVLGGCWRSKRRSEVAPAVGGQHGGVEFGVQFGEHGDQAELVRGALFGSEGAACAQGVEHVVERGETEGAGVLGEHLFAVASMASARSAMRWRSAGVRLVSASGKGKVSKQRVLT
jgi:hypothetical protein